MEKRRTFPLAKSKYYIKLLYSRSGKKCQNPIDFNVISHMSGKSGKKWETEKSKMLDFKAM